MKRQTKFIAFFLFVITLFFFIGNISFASGETGRATLSASANGLSYFQTETSGPVFIMNIEAFHDSHEIWRPSLPVLKFTIELPYDVSSSYSKSIYYQRLLEVEQSDDVRKQIVNIAKSQVGYCEGNNGAMLSGEEAGKRNYTEFGNWYGMQDEWCAMFVSWCANLAGETNVPKHALCSAGLKKFIANGTAHSRSEIAKGNYVPQPGDIIYFLDSDSAAEGRITSHVGIVEKYEDGYIYTIEGNAGNAVKQYKYSIKNTYVAYVCELI